MKKFFIYFILILALLGCIAYKSTYIRQKLDAYATQVAEERFGSLPLAPEQEKKIASIALEMGITEPITIRKMSTKAIQTFGYYNAFAYFSSTIWNLIPISDKPFLFISEGFFEDLSPEEQRFIIGHELIHINERHTPFLSLSLLILLVALLIFWNFVRKYLKTFFSYGLFCLLCSIPTFTRFAYKRSMERVADHKSMQILKSYDGGIKLIERWEKEFHLPPHNPYFGLLSDHPSCSERKNYCLYLKNTIES